ncbi:unnamed protein product, partial [Laminaria digitata]
AQAEAELGAALAGERIRRDGELTEIKSVVDEMMTLDASASGGGVAGIVNGDLLYPPRSGFSAGRGSPTGYRGGVSGAGAGAGVGAGIGAARDGSARDVGSVRDGSARDVGYARDFSSARDGAARGGAAASPGSSRRRDGNNRDRSSSSVVAGAAARLTEAWSLLEASEAARRRLQGEVKGWAERAAALEEALAAAEASLEGKAREARLLAASLQDAKEGLEAEEAARREAEGRAEALRSMLQAGGGGSGGGVSPAGGGAGGDVARSLAGQVKALRSRVEELLERARDAEV